MESAIKSSILNLKSLADNGIYSVARIEWWLLKFEDLFQSVSSSYTTLCNKCVNDEKVGVMRSCVFNLTYCPKTDEKWEFIQLYESFDKLTQIHKNEILCNHTLSEYSKLPLSLWANSYIFLGERLQTFYWDYLDYGKEDDLDKNLFISEVIYPDLHIYVDKDDFQNIRQFIELFYNVKSSITCLKSYEE